MVVAGKAKEIEFDPSLITVIVSVMLCVELLVAVNPLSVAFGLVAKAGDTGNPGDSVASTVVLAAFRLSIV